MDDTSERGIPGNPSDKGDSQTESETSLTVNKSRAKPLRVWPAIVLVVSLWVLREGPGLFEDSSVPLMMAYFMGPLACAGLIILWWLFLSRAALTEKLIGLVGLVAIMFTANALADKSVKGFGIMFFGMPWGISAFALMLVVSRHVAPPRRALLALLAALVGFGFWDLVRTDEIRGDFQTARSWRWQPTAEDRFLQELSSRELDASVVIDSQLESSVESLVESPEWPAFRGPQRDGRQPGIVLADICGKRCVLTLTNGELTMVDPDDGQLLGEHAWDYEGYRVVQPLVLGDSSILMGSPMGTGTRRIDLSLEGDEINVVERWTSRRMNPYYNDYVAHQGYLYGFDHTIFACVDLENGERKWKKGRYGNGQVLLLPDADQLLVISEDGELVLLRATPEKLTELAKYRVLDGRTWNHPVLVGNRLYVRNAEEAACFEMPMATPPTSTSAKI